MMVHGDMVVERWMGFCRRGEGRWLRKHTMFIVPESCCRPLLLAAGADMPGT
jgi:hypothetical protein